MKRITHKVWQVQVASRDDGPVKCVQDLPARGTYLIESNFKNGNRILERKAFKLAAEDGITRPIVLSMEWINSPHAMARGERDNA